MIEKLFFAQQNIKLYKSATQQCLMLIQMPGSKKILPLITYHLQSIYTLTVFHLPFLNNT